MTTCLDPNTCPGDKMYNIVCNFSIGINHYACNPQTTCIRTDGKYDCCANNIVRCVVDAASLLAPTIQPIILISETNCNKKCNKIDKCYWYESLQTDNLCVENNNEYCCYQNSREECCMTNKTGAYIVFGCIAGIMIVIILAYYWYYVKKPHHKIVPTNEPVFV